MTDYRHVFGEDVALGLGLGQPLLPSVDERVEDYRLDPIGAFGRVAARLQPPGGDIPVPFTSRVTVMTSPQKEQ